VEGSRECGNELSVSMKYWEFLEWVHSLWFLDQCSVHSVSQLVKVLNCI
jgi:hypothetical protein